MVKHGGQMWNILSLVASYLDKVQKPLQKLKHIVKLDYMSLQSCNLSLKIANLTD